VENETLGIWPLTRNEYAPLTFNDDFCATQHINLSFGKPHFIKKSLQYFADLNLYHLNNFRTKRLYIKSMEKKLTIELAVFFDDAAYRTFMPLLDNDNEKIHCMLLMYVNCIRAAYRHPSLGVSIDISLVRLDIMKKQPLVLPAKDPTYVNLLALSCKYATSLNPPNDNNPRHWDVALYVTGIDLFTHRDIPIIGKFFKNYAPMGIAYVDYLCVPNFSCALIEIPAPAPNILAPILISSLSAVHEIGHLYVYMYYFYLLINKVK